MDCLSTAWTVVSYIAFPVFYILNLILNFILFLLVTITAPLLHLSHYSLHACWSAFRFLGKFETLYVFFGIAALVGIATGTSLHYILGFIISVSSLDSSPGEQRVRTLVSYRAAKQKRRNMTDRIVKVRQKDQKIDHKLRENYKDWNFSIQDRGRGVNRFNTILEEEDSSDGF